VRQANRKYVATRSKMSVPTGSGETVSHVHDTPISPCPGSGVQVPGVARVQELVCLEYSTGGVVHDVANSAPQKPKRSPVGTNQPRRMDWTYLERLGSNRVGAPCGVSFRLG